MFRNGDPYGIGDFVSYAAQFRRPEPLLERLELLRAKIPRSNIFNDPSLKSLKEALTAGLFGLGFEVAYRVPVDVRIMEPDPFPDFQLRLDERVLDFEATAAREPGLGSMHRGDATLGPPKLGPVPAGIKEFDPTELVRVVRLKVQKRYASAPHLLVYLVLEGSRIKWESVREAVRVGGGEAFASVWVISPTHFMCAMPWPGLDGGGGWVRLPLKGAER